MSDFNPRADSVNVEQIMEQIRGRIREKRGVDYSEQQVQELAKAKLEQLLDPTTARTDVLEHLRKLQPAYEPPELPAYEFEDTTIFDSHRGLLRFVRRLLSPILKLFFNPNPLIGALHTQSRLNAMYAEREAKRDATRKAGDQLQYELLNNLLVEITRTGVEVKSLTMRIESIGSRLEFNERRARALESAMPSRASGDAGADRLARGGSQPAPPTQPPKPVAPQAVPSAAGAPGAPGQPGEGSGRSRRRRRRRGRRGGAASMPGPSVPTGGPVAPAPSAGGPGPMGTTATEDLENFSGAASPTEGETRDPGASDVDDPQ